MAGVVLMSTFTVSDSFILNLVAILNIFCLMYMSRKMLKHASNVINQVSKMLNHVNNM